MFSTAPAGGLIPLVPTRDIGPHQLTSVQHRWPTLVAVPKIAKTQTRVACRGRFPCHLTPSRAVGVDAPSCLPRATARVQSTHRWSHKTLRNSCSLLEIARLTRLSALLRGARSGTQSKSELCLCRKLVRRVHSGTRPVQNSFHQEVWLLPRCLMAKFVLFSAVLQASLVSGSLLFDVCLS